MYVCVCAFSSAQCRAVSIPVSIVQVVHYIPRTVLLYNPVNVMMVPCPFFAPDARFWLRLATISPFRCAPCATHGGQRTSGRPGHHPAHSLQVGHAIHADLSK